MPSAQYRPFYASDNMLTDQTDVVALDLSK